MPEYLCLASHLDISSETFPQDQRQFPLDRLATELLQTLRQISYMVSLPNITPYQKQAVASTAINTEYLIFSATSSLTPQTQPLAILSEAFTLASLLYLHLTFRLLPSFPNPSKLHLRLVSEILNLISSLSLSQFASPEAIDLLLWIVFICSSASGSGYPRYEQTQTGIESDEGIMINAQDFVVLMRKVYPEIVGQSKTQVRQRLKSVVWRDGVCDVLHDGIWGIVESMRGRNAVNS
jgi:hypothetical protein